MKLLEGASVRPFGFFTMRFGAVRRMAIDETAPQPLAAEDMFAFGGGLSLMFGTDCAYGRAPRTCDLQPSLPARRRSPLRRGATLVPGARDVLREDVVPHGACGGAAREPPDPVP